MQVDAVEKRPGNLLSVTADLSIRAGTFPLRISKVSAGTWIHRRYQDKIRRIGEGCIHTGNMYFSVFQRLAQDFQHRSWKFRQLVQEKYAAVSQGYFPRSGDTAAADEPRHGDRMMRTSKRALPHDIFRFIEAGDAVDLRHFERFFPRHRRKDGRDAAGQHGFPGTRRPCHQYIVRSGSCDLHRLLGEDLPLHLSIVYITHHFAARLVAFCRCHLLAAAEKFHQIPECLRPIDRDILTEKCFTGHLFGHDKFGNPRFTSGKHHGENAGDRADLSLERELSDEHDPFERFFCDIAARSQKANSDRKIQSGAIFFEVCRSQIHRHFVDRKVIAGVPDGRVYAFLRLFDRRCRKSHDVKGGKILIDVDFDADHMTIQTERGRAQYLCIHRISSFEKGNDVGFRVQGSRFRVIHRHGAF